MIVDCPSCRAGLMYDPESGKMKCEACDRLYEIYELDEELQARRERELRNNFFMIDSTVNTSLTDNIPEKAENYKVIQLDDSTDAIALDLDDDSENNNANINDDKTSSETIIDDGMMECKIYSCNSCGAEVSINDVEASTFCSFCGQPTVVFNRISYQKKPEYIIPFSVTKERAIELISDRLGRGSYVPKSVKNFELEHVRGIYIPFWLYDMHYYDDQYLKGIVEELKLYFLFHFHREAECDFSMLPLDASIQLNDEISQRLEPYDVEGIKEFSFAYLSGFYSDCYDITDTQLDYLAVKRAAKLFNEQVERTISSKHIKLLKSNPEYNITDTHYAMFPAWFLTFRYENIPYTLVVNGQTEKIIGGIPYDRYKVSSDFTKLAVIITIIATFFSYFLITNPSDSANKMLLWLILMSGYALIDGIRNLKNIKKITKLTALSETVHYVKDRNNR